MTRRQFIKACEAIGPGITVDIGGGRYMDANLNAPDGFTWGGELHSFVWQAESPATKAPDFYREALADFQERASQTSLEPYTAEQVADWAEVGQ